MKKRIPIFYGWIIVLAGLIVTAAGIGIFSSTAPAFIIPVCDSLGFTRGEFTFHRTIITIVSALCLPAYGSLYMRFGAKKILLVCTVGYVLTFFGYSVSTEIWHFYLLAAVNGAFTNGFNFLLLGSLINEWFDDRKALATSIAYCGSGIGGAIALPIAGQMIEAFGWRAAYRLMCVAGALFLIFAALLVVDHPHQMDLTAYYDPKKAQGRAKAAAGQTDSLTLRQAMGTHAFWLMATAFLLTSVCAVGPNTHTLPYLQDIGYSAESASLIMSAAMLMLTVGKIILGGIYDRYGTATGNLFVGGNCILTPLLALASGSPLAAWTFSVTLGFETSGYSVPVSTLVNRYFGGKYFTEIFSVCTFLTTVGGVVSVPMMGWIYDYFQSYDLAWKLLFFLGAVAMVCFAACDMVHQKEAQKRFSHFAHVS